MNDPNQPSSSPSANGETSAPLRFVPLRVHSSYSLLEGALPIGKLADMAASHGFPAVGISDTNNLFGALEFSEKMAAAGVQPIIGVTLAVDFEEKPPGNPVPGTATARGENLDGRIALIAKSERGYANLMKIVSQAHLGVDEGDPPHVKASYLFQHTAGIIALTGGPDGPIDKELQDSRATIAADRIDRLWRAFEDRLYIELQRVGTRNERAVESQLLDIAYDRAIPIVATNEAFFKSPDDYEAHDALICIAEGRYVVEDDRRRMTPEQYFKSTAQMEKVFADLPEALDNTIEIARRCHYRPLRRNPILPSSVTAPESVTAEELLEAEAVELARVAKQGLDTRLQSVPLAQGHTREDYDKRLAYELEVITNMKFPGYFLIVSDFIKWAKAQGIPVGPGRGSGAGSLVAWVLTITDLDPLRFGLLFERFLNPERVSMPDFDIDFCQDRREEVIAYVQQKYGHDRVAQIITHGKLQARAVLRDVGRVLQMPYGQVDRLCKLVPNNPANPITLPEALATEPKLQQEQQSEPIVAHLLEIAQKLEGLYRHASTHAAGMVIGDRPLDELVPLYRDPKSSMPVTQFNWKMVEAAGLVKFDFLGLKTLTVLRKAVELVKKGRGIDVDLAAVELTDKASFDLLAKADTVGVFQLESTGMRESLKQLKPDRFEDIIAMVALYRPGPMDNIPTYINRKHGEEPVDYLHPMLKDILEETYGVIIYQEQVIQIAQVMGGYSLGQADMLRRAMGKKDKAEMARQQARFVEGAVERGVTKKDATYIFKLVDKFAGYGFNKSHAAAYALVSYHTAYMKANYREEFLAASMTLDMANTDKLAVFAAEARRSGITIEPPCVNHSSVEFTAQAPKDSGEAGAIRYALAALKNIGTAAVHSIIEAREENGAYESLADFANRLNAKAVNKRAIETIAQAGGFDCLEKDRAAINDSADIIMAMAQRAQADADIGTSDLFGSGDVAPTISLRDTKRWTPLSRLDYEFKAIGFFLSGHPLDQYEKPLQKLGIKTYAQFEADTERGATSARLAGIVVAARERRSARGNKFAFAMFSDQSGQFEAVVFADTLARAEGMLAAGTPVLITVEAERDGDTVKMRAQAIESLEQAVARARSGLQVVVDAGNLTAGKNGKGTKAVRQTFSHVKTHLTPPRKGIAGGPVRLIVNLPHRNQQVAIGIDGKFDVSPDVAGVLSTLPGVVKVTEL